MKNKEIATEEKNFGATGYCLIVFLFFLFFNATGLFGLKFAASVAISWTTGFVIWFARILFQDGSDSNILDESFCWWLFLLFPLFIPLALPLWIIPFILTITYLITIVAFGGHGKHIFNPIIVASVFLLYGYNDLGLIAPSCALPTPYYGYKTWTSGMPPKKDIREIYAYIPSKSIFTLSISNKIPNIPGSCYSNIILLTTLVFGILFKRRLTWLISSIIFILLNSYIFFLNSTYQIPPINILFLGITPSLLLCGIIDATTIPDSRTSQIINALIFSILAVFTIYNSTNILAPVYSFLISQIVSPLIIDLIEKKQ